MRKEIQSWFEEGCELKTGLATLIKYGSIHVQRIVQINPEQNKHILVYHLARIAGIDVKNKIPTPVAQNSQENTRLKFRDEFPFLTSPNCPIELKALITDKFSSFYAYRQLHIELRNCVTLDKCAQVSKSLLENYTENKLIYAELDYYKQHGVILGKHPIFKHYERMNTLRKLSIKELVRKQTQLQHNIWRIQDEIKKGDKPHLDADRTSRMNNRIQELNEVNKLLGE